MKESVLQTKIKKQLERDGWLVVKILQCTLNGWPDLQAHKDGKTLFIEVKRPGGKASDLQLYRHKQLKEKGFEVLIIDTDEYKRYIPVS